MRIGEKIKKTLDYNKPVMSKPDSSRDKLQHRRKEE